MKQRDRDFDRRLLRRFWHIARRYWVGSERKPALAHLVVLTLNFLYEQVLKPAGDGGWQLPGARA